MRRVLFALPVVFASALVAQQPAAKRPAAGAGKLPVDSAVTIGSLPNGIRYYIRENHRPEKRAELRLVVNAGSILEQDDQRGLAHVVEHMAFNGTEHFQKQELVSFIEKSGMRFGADLNAYTSFDETVYMLTMPTDGDTLLVQGIQILEDWAHNITFDTTEIQKERGVVIEEWRLGQGAGERMRKQTFPVLFRGSRYPDRMPIGTKESLDGFKPEAVTRFYRDWYRPELMAVVAVGDFDRKMVEKVIREHFSRIPASKAPKPRTKYSVPVRKDATAVVATDKEATRTIAQVSFFRPTQDPSTMAAYRTGIVNALYSSMLNDRLSEIAQKPNAPFLGAGGGVQGMVRSMASFSLGAAVTDSSALRGLESVLTEVERIERHGFVITELERAKKQMLRGVEQAYAERDKANSRGFADQYVDNFLTAEPIPGIVRERDLAQKLIPSITLAEVNGAARTWLGVADRAIVVSTPEGSASAGLSKDTLLAVFNRAAKADVAPYQETVSDAPLVAAKLAPAKIVTETKDSALGTTSWTLANGVRVIMKPTDFKADQVQLYAFSPGGSGLVADSMFRSAQLATNAVVGGGVAQFNAVELDKKLTGTVAQIMPFIGSEEEGFQGFASPKDMETLFELAYLRFTAPRADTATFAALKSNVRTSVQHRNANPGTAFSDTLTALLTKHHPRAKPFTSASVDSIRLDQAMAIYKDRFADASDFTFVMVGSFSVDSVRPLVQKYLGNLPSLKRGEKAGAIDLSPPDGIETREVRKGVEPKATTQFVFSGPFTFTRENRFLLDAMASILEIRLREQLREERSGTYGVSVNGSSQLTPTPRYTVAIGFGSAPDRVDELEKAVMIEIDSLKIQGPTAEELAKVRETAVRERETNLKENGFWLGTLVSAIQWNEDPHTLLDQASELKLLTPENIKKAAEQYINMKRYVKVVLLPEISAGK